MYIQPIMPVSAALPLSSLGPIGTPRVPPTSPARESRPCCDSVEISPAGEHQADELIAPKPRNDVDAKLVHQLSEEERRVVEQLKTRDREVRAHEQAHLAAAGPYARGAPKFEYQEGPDGRRYAVGGEVEIDTSPIPGDPEATLRKAQVLRAAAMAPAEPSAQDRRVAAAAAKMETQARRELNEQQQEHRAEKSEDVSGAGSLVGGLLDILA
jgi:hypothetical protein